MSQHLSVTSMVCSHRMSELSEVYRKNLNAICIERGWVSQKDPTKGSPSELVKLLKRSSSFWSDRLSGRKPISIDLSYEIEDAFDLPRLALADWDDPGASNWPLSPQLMAVLLRLDSEGLRKAENVLRSHLDLPPLPRVENEKAA